MNELRFHKSGVDFLNNASSARLFGTVLSWCCDESKEKRNGGMLYTFFSRPGAIQGLVFVCVSLGFACRRILFPRLFKPLVLV